MHSVLQRLAFSLLLAITLPVIPASAQSPESARLTNLVKPSNELKPTLIPKLLHDPAIAENLITAGPKPFYEPGSRLTRAIQARLTRLYFEDPMSLQPWIETHDYWLDYDAFIAQAQTMSPGAAYFYFRSHLERGSQAVLQRLFDLYLLEVRRAPHLYTGFVSAMWEQPLIARWQIDDLYEWTADVLWTLSRKAPDQLSRLVRETRIADERVGILVSAMAADLPRAYLLKLKNALLTGANADDLLALEKARPFSLARTDPYQATARQALLQLVARIESGGTGSIGPELYARIIRDEPELAQRLLKRFFLGEWVPAFLGYGIDGHEIARRDGARFSKDLKLHSGLLSFFYRVADRDTVATFEESVGWADAESFAVIAPLMLEHATYPSLVHARADYVQARKGRQRSGVHTPERLDAWVAGRPDLKAKLGFYLQAVLKHPEPLLPLLGENDLQLALESRKLLDYLPADARTRARTLRDFLENTVSGAWDVLPDGERGIEQVYRFLTARQQVLRAYVRIAESTLEEDIEQLVHQHLELIEEGLTVFREDGTALQELARQFVSFQAWLEASGTLSQALPDETQDLLDRVRGELNHPLAFSAEICNRIWN